jgi:hypothetical protein
MDEQIELELEPLSTRFGPHDDRWLDQIAGLTDELRSDVGGIATRRTSATGTKGAASTVVLSLASAGGLSAAAELIRSWVGRDRTRSVKVSWHESGEIQTIELSSSDGNLDAFDGILAKLSGHHASEP